MPACISLLRSGSSRTQGISSSDLPSFDPSSQVHRVADAISAHSKTRHAAEHYCDLLPQGKHFHSILSCPSALRRHYAVHQRQHRILLCFHQGCKTCSPCWKLFLQQGVPANQTQRHSPCKKKCSRLYTGPFPFSPLLPQMLIYSPFLELPPFTAVGCSSSSQPPGLSSVAYSIGNGICQF